MDESAKAEGGESDKKIVHVYPLVKVRLPEITWHLKSELNVCVCSLFLAFRYERRDEE
jgi:hypothetical protein